MLVEGTMAFWLASVSEIGSLRLQLRAFPLVSVTALLSSRALHALLLPCGFVCLHVPISHIRNFRRCAREGPLNVCVLHTFRGISTQINGFCVFVVFVCFLMRFAALWRMSRSTLTPWSPHDRQQLLQTSLPKTMNKNTQTHKKSKKKKQTTKKKNNLKKD